MSYPAWFSLGETFLFPVIDLAERIVRTHESVRVRVAAECSAMHLAHSLYASIELNRQGKHAVAVSLIRQCVESLTILELGLIEPDAGEALVDSWRGGKLHGKLRQELEAKVWNRYGTGLWDEPWSSYFANLARAVQDYAHYTPALQGWQMVVPEGARLHEMKDGMLLGMLKYGRSTYDKNKATRATLLHVLIGWTVGRLIAANGGHGDLDEQRLYDLQSALAESDILAAAKLDWAYQFWPLEFDGIDVRRDT